MAESAPKNTNESSENPSTASTVDKEAQGQRQDTDSIKEYEMVQDKLKQLEELRQKATTSQAANSEEIDSRSIFVSNVDFHSSPEDVQAYFKACGPVKRVTILRDRYTGRPKGCAYVEFATVDCVASALLLNDSTFKDRIIKVTPKRTNTPGFAGRGRGRGGRGGRGRGAGPHRGGGRGRGGRYAPY